MSSGLKPMKTEMVSYCFNYIFVYAKITTPIMKGWLMNMKTIKKLKEDIWVIKDCRHRVRKAREAGYVMNTKFLAHIASIPEWTIVIFNRK